MTQILIKIDGVTIDQANVTSIPTDRRFRDSWKLDGDVIEVDLDKAREQYRDEVRVARKSLFEQFDVPIAVSTAKTTFNGALTQNELDAGLSDEANRKKLRDAPDDIRIDAAVDVPALEVLDVLDFLP